MESFNQFNPGLAAGRRDVDKLAHGGVPLAIGMKVKTKGGGKERSL